jgi:UDP-N-acetylmuramoylalanine--D-glutamate ligase
VLVVNADDPVAARLAAGARARVIAVSADGGSHDLLNARAATAAAVAVGADPACCAAALASFTAPPHRVQLVAEIDGVQYVDDSKATNPHATESALGRFPSVVLIAGGRNKDLDLRGLAAHAARVRAVVAIGEAAGEVGAAFAGTGVPVVGAGTMHDAVRTASAHAQPGDVVLLSPACASFDWYSSYAARGDDFAREVRALARDSGPHARRSGR